MTQYRTKDNDMIDDICYRHYGYESALTAVLEANPALAEQPDHLPAGLIINLPTIAPPENTQTLSLWD
jgi:phage tail protein X